jgi:hypothetical protein
VAVRFYHEVEEDIYITATLDLYIVTYYTCMKHTHLHIEKTKELLDVAFLLHICSFALDSRIESKKERKKERRERGGFSSALHKHSTKSGPRREQHTRELICEHTHTNRRLDETHSYKLVGL